MLDQIIKKIQNFRKLPVSERKEIIDAFKKTHIGNITLVQAIKNAGPTLTSILGAMEPLTAVVIGVFVFNELFTLNTLIGILLIR